MKEVEMWVPIPGFPGYEVSDWGGVRSVKYGDQRIRKLIFAKRGGYPQLALRADGVSYLRKVHSLVMLAFVGPRPDDLEIRHLDGDVRNARLSNLRYGTHLENAADQRGHGTNANLRKTHCPKGHLYDEANTRFGSRGQRFCIACSHEYARAHKALFAARAREKRRHSMSA